MERQNQTYRQVKTQIRNQLQLLREDNFFEVKKKLEKYLFSNLRQIIQKSVKQPQYAFIYAKLCVQFVNFSLTDFKFEEKKLYKKNKDNPFKIFLILEIVRSFDKQDQQQPEFNNDQQKDQYFRNTKKKILGNSKLIAQLIRAKVIKKKIMKIYISQLIYDFLTKYYCYRKTTNLIYSYYDYYLEALIQFIDTLGQFYEKMDYKKEGKSQRAAQDYQKAEKIIIDLIQMNIKPTEHQMTQISDLNADDYFKLLQVIDHRILQHYDLIHSALFNKIKIRRANNWNLQDKIQSKQ